MRRVAGIVAAIALFAAVITDGTSNTVMFGAIAKPRLGELSLGYTVDHPISSPEEAR